MGAKQEIPKPGPGRPENIDDARLESVRDDLVQLLESTWCDVGHKLGIIKTAGNVRRALRPWESYRNRSEPVEALLRSSKTRSTTPKALNDIRRQLKALNQRVLEAKHNCDHHRESFGKADQTLAFKLSRRERQRVVGVRRQRARLLSKAEEEHQSLKNKLENLERSLRDGEACFAREELVRFCRGARYRITPLHTANAIAGLPFIGYRQSTKRCLGFDCEVANGLTYQVFKTVFRVVDSWNRRRTLVGHAEHWLRARRSSESQAILAMQQNWYYLRSAIEKVGKSKRWRFAKELPYAITREYLKRSSRRSAADLLFEEEQRIRAWIELKQFE